LKAHVLGTFRPLSEEFRRVFPNAINDSGYPMSAIEYEGITSVSCSIVGVRFAADSPLEGDGFEPSVPFYILTVSDPR
jgi:hypothetical protein